MHAKRLSVRESSFELIRILAQVFIVFYHLFCFFVYPVTERPFDRAIWLPLHIGVILFVLISGYFGIKPSVKGFIKLIGTMIVLYVPIGIVNYILVGGTIKDLVQIFLFVSTTHFWFMRTYIFLYLLVPLINPYLKKSSLVQRIYIILALGFISHYVGTIGFDPSLSDGKNVVTFLFLYAIGDTLKLYREKWSKIPSYIYGVAYILFNIILVWCFSVFTGKIWDFIYYRAFFAYCSFGLLVSSLLFFMWIGSLSFKSRFINYVAASSLSIYMLHCSYPIFFGYIGPFVRVIVSQTPNPSALVGIILVVTLVIVTLCVILDKCLTPIWKLLSKGAEKLQTKSEILLQRRFNRTI